MRTVTGYVNGHPIYRDDGPAFARVQGHGGSALGHFQGVVLTRPSKEARSAAAQRGLERKRLVRAQLRGEGLKP